MCHQYTVPDWLVGALWWCKRGYTEILHNYALNANPGRPLEYFL